ncbi:hypothetical protein RhiirA5_434561 [Rhizophagus irregularis]|uniref:Uncharacterized protein n=1 Tax=Rhizophagus irregularis TaxID=588596 RepID=A0A2N0NPV0_9GLOM|nr:hypothetical protein RhiirA5_434561 [Rhizophagus irregularis]
MSSELELLRQCISELETKNTKLEVEKAEIEVRNLETMAEIVKLRAELKSRIEELEKSRADTAVENTRRDDRVEELEQKIEVRFALLEKGSLVVNGRQQNDKETIAEVLAINVSDSVIDQQNDANTKSINDKEIDDFIPEEPANVAMRLLENRKTDAFLDEVHKKKESSPEINTSCEADFSMTSTELVTLPEQVVKESISKESSAESAIPCELKPSGLGNKQNTLPKKIPYNQKVEQDLICELLEFIRCHDSTSLPNSISTEKTGQKEKLRWYYYSEEYKKKVVALSSENNISDQMARTQIYDEMELYLSGIGMDKIGVVTCSADVISRLTDAQIQNIINLYIDELTKSQKLISVNCSRARDLPAESESKKLDTKVLPIPLAHVSNNSSDNSSKIDLVNSPKAEVSTSSTTSSSQINKSNKSRLPISILPEDPEEKRKHIIGLVLERFPSLSLNDSSERGERFNFNSSTFCPLCNEEHKEKSIWNDIRGEWGAGEYYGE